MRRAPRSSYARTALAMTGAALLAAAVAFGGPIACAAPQVLPSDGADGPAPLHESPERATGDLPGEKAPDKAGEGSASIEAAGVKNLSLSWREGEARIAVTDEGDRIELTDHAAQEAPDGQKASWSVSGGELRIEDDRGGGRGRSGHRRLELLIPRSVAQKLGSVDIKGAEGSCEVADLGCDSMTIDLSSGSLKGHGLRANELKTNLAKGNIRVSGSFSDSVRVASAAGRSSVACEGGCPRTVHVDLASGKVELLVPRDSGFTLQAEKLGGRFSSDFPLEREGSSFVAGDGGSDVSANLLKGEFRIAPLDR